MKTKNNFLPDKGWAFKETFLISIKIALIHAIFSGILLLAFRTKLDIIPENIIAVEVFNIFNLPWNFWIYFPLNFSAIIFTGILVFCISKLMEGLSKNEEKLTTGFFLFFLLVVIFNFLVAIDVIVINNKIQTNNLILILIFFTGIILRLIFKLKKAIKIGISFSLIIGFIIGMIFSLYYDLINCLFRDFVILFIFGVIGTVFLFSLLFLGIIIRHIFLR